MMYPYNGSNWLLLKTIITYTLEMISTSYIFSFYLICMQVVFEVLDDIFTKKNGIKFFCNRIIYIRNK
jgi:hypothetical protein